MPSIIHVGFRSLSEPDVVRGSFDLGRELIELGRRLQSDGIDAWAMFDGGAITDGGIPVGAWRVDEQRGQWAGGDMCGAVDDDHRELIEHYRCTTYRDGVVTEGGRIVYEPANPTEKGRIRV